MALRRVRRLDDAQMLRKHVPPDFSSPRRLVSLKGRTTMRRRRELSQHVTKTWRRELSQQGTKMRRRELSQQQQLVCVLRPKRLSWQKPVGVRDSRQRWQQPQRVAKGEHSMRFDHAANAKSSVRDATTASTSASVDRQTYSCLTFECACWMKLDALICSQSVSRVAKTTSKVRSLNMAVVVSETTKRERMNQNETISLGTESKWDCSCLKPQKSHYNTLHDAN